MSKQARVLVLDIETAPILAYVWDLWDQNVSLNQIHTDRYVMAWSAKWLNEDKMFYYDKRGKKPGDDKGILLPLWKLLDEADIIITQNGKKFDAKRINARFMFHRMKPPSPYKHWDTLILAKGVADFTSNKLEYLAAQLNEKHTKSYHRKYPGFTLWKGCLDGKRDAWNEMKMYNIADVKATEELYLNLRAWAPSTFPSIHIVEKKEEHCATCGEDSLVKYGVRAGFQRFNCNSCGAWSKVKIKGAK